ncbi:MAG: CocE/NonD family hydrolase [Polyangiaceae bacterium]
MAPLSARTAPLALCIATAACSTAPQVQAQTPRQAPAAVHEPLIEGSIDDAASLAQAIREHYTKYEYRVPMRDGVRLHTTAYVPKDRSRRYPILMQRTPYSVAPYGVDNYPQKSDERALRRLGPSAAFIADGFIILLQDVRGRMMSEGEFVDIRPRNATGVDEATDAWDTVDWAIQHVPANNGKVGVWGISYPGFYAAMAAVDAHPAVKAVSPQAPVTDWFAGDDFHHNGAFFLADAFGFFSSFGKARPKPTAKMTWGFDYDAGDAYEFFLRLGPLANANAEHLQGKIGFWNELMAHGNLDAFWQARNPRPHYRNAKPAVMTVGGWFDAEDLFGALETYRAFEAQSPGADNTLVMGPWSHGGWAREDGDHHGDIPFGAKTSRWYRTQVELPFFQHYLKGVGKAPPEALVFETGSNLWHHHDRWPPRGAKLATFYFDAGGQLSRVAPTTTGEAYDEYRSDPEKPVPYMAVHAERIDRGYMTADQRFASRRPDVVSYQTEPLTSDLALAGPLEATLFVSTTGTDADFVVKLVDVYPAHVDDGPQGQRLSGYQQLVRAEIIRGKFRDSLAQPAPFSPGQVTAVKLKLPDVAHSFRTGHRIMVQVQSSWFPLVDRNPQTFTDIYSAKASDFHAADIRIHRSAGKASALAVTLAPTP